MSLYLLSSNKLFSSERFLQCSKIIIVNTGIIININDLYVLYISCLNHVINTPERFLLTVLSKSATSLMHCIIIFLIDSIVTEPDSLFMCFWIMRIILLSPSIIEKLVPQTHITQLIYPSNHQYY